MATCKHQTLTHDFEATATMGGGGDGALGRQTRAQAAQRLHVEPSARAARAARALQRRLHSSVDELHDKASDACGCPRGGEGGAQAKGVGEADGALKGDRAQPVAQPMVAPILPLVRIAQAARRVAQRRRRPAPEAAIEEEAAAQRGGLLRRPSTRASRRMS